MAKSAFEAVFSVVFVAHAKAVTQNAVEFAQVQARRIGLNCFNNRGGVPFCAKEPLKPILTLSDLFLSKVSRKSALS